MNDSKDSQNVCNSVLKSFASGRGRGGPGFGTLLTAVHPVDDHRQEAHGLETQRRDVKPSLIFHREVEQPPHTPNPPTGITPTPSGRA